MSALMKGRTFSAETIERMRVAARTRKKRPRQLVQLNCHRCGSIYLVPKYRASVSRYCSRECTKHDKRCERCNKTITKRPGRRRFCSIACSSAFMVGDQSPVWKGGVSRGKSRKEAAKLRAWSRSVFERDKFRCQCCGSTKNLHAHHIKPYAKYPSLRLEVSNGKTLCSDCHSAVHGHKPMAAGRKCVGCGAPCTGSNRQGKPRCRSCGVKHWHSLGRPTAQENTDRMRQLGLPLA